MTNDLVFCTRNGNRLGRRGYRNREGKVVKLPYRVSRKLVRAAKELAQRSDGSATC